MHDCTMKTLISALGAGVLALLGASAYLTWQLGSERSRAQRAESEVAELEARVKRVEIERTRESERAAAATARVTAPAPPAARTRAQEMAAPDSSGGTAMVREENFQLRLNRVPSSRALVRADKIEQLKQQYPNLGRVLGMSEAEAADFIGFLADQQQRQDLSMAKAAQNGQFRDFQAQREQAQREIAQRLGAERVQKYDAYVKGLPDRSQVRSFRGRLSDSDALSDSQADALGLALQQQREQYSNELKAEVGSNATFTMGGANGMLLMTNISPSDEDAQEKQLVEQIETYNKRAHDAAASLLSPRQLKSFEEFQQAQLTSQRLRIRSMRDTVPAK
jgi:hypothetical protein